MSAPATLRHAVCAHGRHGTAILAAIGLAAGVSACASSSASEGGHHRLKVVYVPGVTGNPFYTTVGCGAAAEARRLGVDFSTQGAPMFDVTQQTPVVHAVVANGPDALMISNDDPKGLIPPLRQAQAAGVKIVNIDGDLAEKSIGVTNVQSDDTVGGRLAGQAMGRLAGARGGDVLIVDNTPGVAVSEDRRNGFISVLKARYPKLHVLPVQYSTNQTTTAATDVRATAAAHPNLVGVYSVETNNTEAAMTALRQAHLQGKVTLVGYDTSDPVVAGIRSGLVSADIVQYPFGEGEVGLRSAVDAIRGRPVPREQTQPFVVATKANINTPKVQKFIYKTSCPT